MTVFNENRTYGVELEVNTNRRSATLSSAINREFNNMGISATCTNERYNHYNNNNNNWKVVSDATVDGWEVVSPILKGFEGREQIKAVCKALNELGCTVSMQTGMHVHHDARGLTAKQVGGIFGAYSAFQTLLNYGVSQSRRGREYGGYNGIADWGIVTNNGTDTFDRGYQNNITANSVFTGPRDGSFIGALNRKVGLRRETSISIGSSLARHGTIEFRQHQGTINATKIWTWVLITQSIIERQTQNPVRFPKPLYEEIRDGKNHSKGDYIRFKSFIGVIPRRNNNDVEASEPYCWAFRQLYKSIKKFSRQAGIADPKQIGR
jgi:hypothetical protein